MGEMQQRSTGITQEEFSFLQQVLQKIGNFYDARVVGQQAMKNSLIAAVLSQGHILLESVPGLAKTTAAKTIAEAVSGKFSRIQCTPDLLPSDIIGTEIYNAATGTFETRLGPVFANFVLLDEINRSSAKTQSAMLEAMQEKQVTIGSRTYQMPDDVFLVIATENPIEQEGTYPLSEAETDRFLIKEKLTYPSPEEETEILDRVESGIMEKQEPVLSLTDIVRAQQITARVYVDHAIKQYISFLTDATRHPERVISRKSSEYVRMGASPRASIAFLKVSKAIALMHGRTYVVPDDVKEAAPGVLRHRIELNYSAVADDVSVEQIIREIVSNIQTP